MTVERAPREPRWGLGDVAVGLIPIYLGAVALLATRGDADTGDAEITLASLVLGSVFYWAFFVGVPAVATARKGNGMVRDLGLAARPLDLPVGFALGVFTQAVLVPLLYVPVSLFRDIDVSSNARDVTDAASGLGIAALALVVAVGAPIAEELFFRGLLLRSLDRRLGRGWALVGSAVVFGVSHLQGIELPALIMFGLIAGHLAQRTGRLGPSIAAHVGFNAWTLFVLVALHW